MNAWPAATAVLDAAIADRVFPGAIAEIGSASGPLGWIGRGALTYEPGSPPVAADTVYDLASLTKVLSTTALALELVRAGRLDLDDPAWRWWETWQDGDRRKVTVRLLLEHASGLPAHERYFERARGRAAFLAAINATPLAYPPGARSVYSDVGFMLLGFAIEAVAGAPLDAQFDDWLAGAVGGAELRYAPPEAWARRIAPTEQDPWRGRLVCGEVHDENASALGGVAAHAGLFGTAAAVGGCARWWMHQMTTDPLAAAFGRRTRTVPGSSRALGWDTALPTSSCGTRMSAGAVGHTGFTGTSLWIDVERNRYVVLLTNRVHPTRTGNAMSRVRAAFHDAVADDLARG